LETAAVVGGTDSALTCDGGERGSALLDAESVLTKCIRAGEAVVNGCTEQAGLIAFEANAAGTGVVPYAALVNTPLEVKLVVENAGNASLACLVGLCVQGALGVAISVVEVVPGVAAHALYLAQAVFAAGARQGAVLAVSSSRVDEHSR
jgi:hypothetical protein